MAPGAPMPASPVSPVGRAVQALLIGGVQGYRYLLKPWLGNACRFEPTCSAYALEALRVHGPWRGAALAGWRLARCHPWCNGGLDPVPSRPGHSTASSAPSAPAAVAPAGPGAGSSPSNP